MIRNAQGPDGKDVEGFKVQRSWPDMKIWMVRLWYPDAADDKASRLVHSRLRGHAAVITSPVCVRGVYTHVRACVCVWRYSNGTILTKPDVTLCPAFTGLWHRRQPDWVMSQQVFRTSMDAAFVLPSHTHTHTHHSFSSACLIPFPPCMPSSAASLHLHKHIRTYRHMHAHARRKETVAMATAPLLAYLLLNELKQWAPIHIPGPASPTATTRYTLTHTCSHACTHQGATHPLHTPLSPPTHGGCRGWSTIPCTVPSGQGGGKGCVLMWEEGGIQDRSVSLSASADALAFFGSLLAECSPCSLSV